MKSLSLIFLFVALFYSAQLRVAHGATRNTAERLEYILIIANSPDCLNYQPFPAPKLQYRQRTNSNWTTLHNVQRVSHTNFTTATRARFDVSRFVVDVMLNESQELEDSTQFRFVQLEHRGGFCDCWAVANLILNETIGLNMQCGKKANLEDIFKTTANQLPGYDQNIVAGFCQDTALIPRQFIAVQSQASSPVPNCTTIALFHTPQTNCSESDTRMEVSFDLRLWQANQCNSGNDFSEGVELSFKNILEDGTTSEWIPLMYFANSVELTQPHVWLIPSKLSGNNGRFTLRGYHTTYTIQTLRDYNYHYNIRMCGGDILQRPLQFRWLQNSFYQLPVIRDVVLLDNVTVRMKNGTYYAVLLEDCFDYQDSLTASRWNLSLSYNIHLLKTNNDGCRPSSGGALFFYAELPSNYFSLPTVNRHGGPSNYTVNSRQLVTNSLDPNSAKWSLFEQEAGDVLSCEPEVTITTTSAEVTTKGISSTNPQRTTTQIDESATTTVPEIATTVTTSEITTEEISSTVDLPTIGTTDDVIRTLEHSIQLAIIKGSESVISRSQLLTLILDRKYATLRYLNDLLNSMRACDVNLTTVAYILSVVVDSLDDQIVEPLISESVLSIGSRLLDIGQNNAEKKTSPPAVLAGSTLLQVIDKFALNNHNSSHIITSDNIKFVIEELSENETVGEIRSPIQDKYTEIRIPVGEVLSGLEKEEPVRMASLLLRNLSGLLPERLLAEGSSNNSDADDRVFRLASPVISASFQCDTCTTSNLSTPVQVTFKHTPYDQALLDNDNETGRVMCVFWKYNATNDQPGVFLYPGQWSKEGCDTNFNSTMTVCKCDHLTHFAILLSARPLDLSPPKLLSLQIIGYIGVSLSLVAMAATIFVFLFLKALRTMRNYIHIQLCVTLGIAQIIFVAGIEPRLGEGHLVGGVPVGCRLVAVLLHYWFLVSFMWMLMEGVVLYVALVRVFVKHHARYIAAFTIASYGLPLLYVGGLTVPLGFVRTDNFRLNQSYDYGYKQACYLNPATFLIWSFIAPVILIFLANIGFFIMAIVIMNRHQKRQHTEKKAHKIKHWLKAIISLTVVMGITWIIGVLVVEIEELCPLAYIFTIFMAFQGLFIFVIFILLSKQVRENYSKWWKAKVAESDFLSKYFGEKSLSSSGIIAAQRSAPSSFTLEKSSNGHYASKSIDKSLAVDSTDSEGKASLGISSCNKANGLENDISTSTFIPLNSNGASLDSRGVANGRSESNGLKRMASPNH